MVTMDCSWEGVRRMLAVILLMLITKPDYVTSQGIIKLNYSGPYSQRDFKSSLTKHDFNDF